MPTPQARTTVALLLTTLLLTACGPHYILVREREQLEQWLYSPPDLTPDPEAANLPHRELTLRLYVDQRQDNPEAAQARLLKLVERASAFYTAHFNLSLRVVEVRTWERTSHPQDLIGTIAELRALDTAQDVGLVIGQHTFVGALSAPSFDAVGRAQGLGRHAYVMFTDYHNFYTPLRNGFPYTPMEELDPKIEASYENQQLITLIHEIGHSLGAIHIEADDYIMSKSSSAKRKKLSNKNKEIILSTLPYIEERGVTRKGQQLSKVYLEHVSLADEVEGEKYTINSIYESKIELKCVDILYSADPHSIRAHLKLNPSQALQHYLPTHPDAPILLEAACKLQMDDQDQGLPPLNYCERLAQICSREPAYLLLSAYAHQLREEHDDAAKDLQRAQHLLENERDSLSMETMDRMDWALDSKRLPPELAQRFASYELKPGTYTRQHQSMRCFFSIPDSLRAPLHTRHALAIFKTSQSKQLDQAAADTEQLDLPESTRVALRCLIAFEGPDADLAMQRCQEAAALGIGSAHERLALLSNKQDNPSATLRYAQEALRCFPTSKQLWKIAAKAAIKLNQTQELEDLREGYKATFEGEAPAW